MVGIRTYVYKRKHRSGAITWMVRWKDPKSGRWIARAGGKTRDEAMIVEAEVRKELLKGNDPAAIHEAVETITVRDVVVRFYQHSRFLSGTERWKHETKQKIANEVLPQLGSKTFAEIDRETLYRFYLSMKERGVLNQAGEKERDVSHATIDKYHGLIRILGDVYTDLAKVEVNPIHRFRDYRKRFPKQAPTRDINFVTPEELERIYLQIRRSKNRLLYPFVRFLANTGLRRSEAQNLKWTDVDRKGGFIHVRKAKKGKTRAVPLDPEAWEAIRGLDRRHVYVFAQPNGDRYFPDSFLRPLQRAGERAKLGKRIDIHTLRHSYGSNKIRAGWGLKKVSTILGHSDISITAQVYAHLLDGDLKVRDETRLDFDKKGEQAESQGTKAADENMAQALANALTKSLRGTREGRRALVELLGQLPEADGTRSSEISRVPARSAEISRDSGVKAPNEGIDAAVLRICYADGELADTGAHGPLLGAGATAYDLSVISRGKMEPMCGFEPQTYALRKRCSTD